MKHTQRSFGNTAKNLFLVFLFLGMLVLCAANWIVDVGVSQLSSNNIVRKIQEYWIGGAIGYELRSSGIAAAEPAQIAINSDGKLIAASDADLDVGTELMRPIWAEALSGKIAPERAEENFLIERLETEGTAVIHYYGSIPVSVIAGWMGGKCESDFAAQTLVYIPESQLLFLRDTDGILYMTKAKVEKGTLQKVQAEWRGVAAEFAAENEAVYPETIMLEREGNSYYLLAPKSPNLLDAESDTSLKALLEAFKYSPYVQPYSEQNGAVEVFVENVSTLRIYSDGLIEYSAAGNNGTVTAFAEGEANGQDAVAAQVDCAHAVLNATLHAVGAKTYASLCAVQTEGDKTTLVFLQIYDGIPILFDQDFATFVFEKGTLLSAQVHIQLFEELEEKAAILPAKQAAASASELQGGLIAAYKLKEDKYVPGRYFLK